MAARKWSRGRRVENLGLVNDDRVMRIDWHGGGALIAELVPRRATAFVLDEQGRVVAVWNPRQGRPGVGDPYVEPDRRQRAAVVDVKPGTWTSMTLLGDDELRLELMRSVDSMAPSIA